MWIWIGAATLVGLLACLVLFGTARARIRYALVGLTQDIRFDLVLPLGLLRRRIDLPRLRARHLIGLLRRRRLRASASGRRRTRLGRRAARWERWFAANFPPALVASLARNVVVRALRIRGTIGSDGPASTALALGALHGLLGVLLGASHAYVGYATEPDVELRPDFQRRRLRLSIDCIVTARLGDLTFAVGLALLRGQFGRRAR